MATMRPHHVLILVTLFLSTFLSVATNCVSRSSSYAVSLPQVVAKAPSSNLNQFCNDTTYPPVCQTALDAGLLPNAGNDLPSVVKANILFALDKLNSTITAANNFIASPTTSPSMVTLLNSSSLEFYKSMQYDYQVALSDADYYTKSTNIDAALTDIATCIDSYTDPMMAAVIQVSLLATEDEELKKVATNIVDLKYNLKP